MLFSRFAGDGFTVRRSRRGLIICSLWYSSVGSKCRLTSDLFEDAAADAAAYSACKIGLDRSEHEPLQDSLHVHVSDEGEK